MRVPIENGIEDDDGDDNNDENISSFHNIFP